MWLSTTTIVNAKKVILVNFAKERHVVLATVQMLQLALNCQLAKGQLLETIMCATARLLFSITSLQQVDTARQRHLSFVAVLTMARTSPTFVLISEFAAKLRAPFVIVPSHFLGQDASSQNSLKRTYPGAHVVCSVSTTVSVSRDTPSQSLRFSSHSLKRQKSHKSLITLLQLALNIATVQMDSSESNARCSMNFAAKANRFVSMVPSAKKQADSGHVIVQVRRVLCCIANTKQPMTVAIVIYKPFARMVLLARSAQILNAHASTDGKGQSAKVK